MSYATQQDLITAFSQRELEQIAPDGSGAISTVAVERALDSADALINSYIERAGYTVPLAEVTDVVVSKALEIARFLLHDDRAPQTVRDRYDDAIRWLEQVAAGKAGLGVSAAKDSARSDNPVSMQSAPARFRRETSKGFL